MSIRRAQTSAKAARIHTPRPFPSGHFYYAPAEGALSDDARLTSVCLSDVCRVHRA